MLSPYLEKCKECSGRIIDTGDEFVCESCGIVTTKEVIEQNQDKAPQVLDYTKYSIGSYLGPLEYGYEEKYSKGFSSTSTGYKYLKLVSDHSGREDSSIYTCAKMIERVCEKLSIPKIVMGQAMIIAKKLFEIKDSINDVNVASISAYSVITACKIEGVTSVGVREIIDAHRMLGKKVKVSALISLSLDSPMKNAARRAEDYLKRVIMRLSSDQRIIAKIEGKDKNSYFIELYEIAKEVLTMIEGYMRGGHNPCALAATTVYTSEVILSSIDSRKRIITQRDVAQCINVAEYTVREQYGEIFRPLLNKMEEVIRLRCYHLHTK